VSSWDRTKHLDRAGIDVVTAGVLDREMRAFTIGAPSIGVNTRTKSILHPPLGEWTRL
jgi:hypothetical protein